MSAGYGHISPRTLEGQIITMVITVFGLPLMVISVGSMGRLAAHLAVKIAASAVRTARALRHWCRRRARRAGRSRRAHGAGGPAGLAGNGGPGSAGASARQRTGTGTTGSSFMHSFSEDLDAYALRRGTGASGPGAVDLDLEPDRQDSSSPGSESGGDPTESHEPSRPFEWEEDQAIEWAPSGIQMLITALAFGTLLVFVAALFVPVEKWDLFQACYFMFITYATIGKCTLAAFYMHTLQYMILCRANSIFMRTRTVIYCGVLYV